MVRNRPRRTVRTSRRRVNNKRNARSIQHIAARQPVRQNLPNDPPALTRTVEGFLKFPIALRFKPNQTTPELVAGNITQPAYYLLTASPSGTISFATLSPSQLSSCMTAYGIGGNSGIYMEIALRKVQLWGPTVTNDATVALEVDVGNDTGHTMIQDQGTMARRPRCALSIPYEIWFKFDNSTTIISFNPDLKVANLYDKEQNKRWDITKTHELGVLHITVHYKISEGI